MSKECILSILLKRLCKAIPTFDILRFDILRALGHVFSVIRFKRSFIRARPLAKKTASLI